MKKRQYKVLHRKIAFAFQWFILGVVTVLSLLLYQIVSDQMKPKFISPLPEGYITPRHTAISPVYAAEMTQEAPNMDTWVDEYSEKFSSSIMSKHQLKATLHYLLLRESRYDDDKGCGDNGKACGPLQFWQDTYIQYRNEMIKLGLTNHIGSRYNQKDAIETTAWALSVGRGKAWGPILREEIKI